VRAQPWAGAGPIAIAPTVAAAAARGAAISDGRVSLQDVDLRQHVRRGRVAARVLILVDASGSMAAQRRLALAKGVVLGLLDSSYQRRDEVGLIIVAGESAELRLPFTRRVEHAEEALRDVPTGGRTPLAHALQLAGELCADDSPALVVLLTDGRANVPTRGGDPWQEAHSAAQHLASVAAAALVIDCEQGPVRLGRARDLADALAAPILPLDEIDEQQLTVRLRHALDRP
jgi:magnesium chelatase subunit D